MMSTIPYELYELERKQLENEFARKETVLEEAYKELHIELEMELALLQERYDALGQLNSGTYLAEKEALTARYQQQMDDNRQELEQLRLEKEDQLNRLKDKYKIPR